MLYLIIPLALVITAICYVYFADIFWHLAEWIVAFLMILPVFLFKAFIQAHQYASNLIKEEFKQQS